MKKTFILFVTLLVAGMSFGQQTGYYNDTDGKDGEELKEALNDIISGHTEFSYYFSKEIFKLSDVDPDNPENVILVYTGRSHDNGDYGSTGNQINREHVWAKSHGGFADVTPMDNDVHNLKPSDASVNMDRSNKDFDNGGTQHPEATGCYYTADTWEPRDEVKGDIARIIFYMSTRYEGENGEMDLEVVDYINTYPQPEHGKLSALLAWNLQDPPDEFERNRNNVIFSFQKNRNPFIDNPLFAEYIWGGLSPDDIVMDDFVMNPELPEAEQPVEISVEVTSGAGSIGNVTLNWGMAYDNLENEISMQQSGNTFTAEIPGQSEDTRVYYQITANDGIGERNSIVYNYYVPKEFNGTITSIYDIQSQADTSIYSGQVVNTTGIITADFGENYYIQDGTGEWNGLFIYDPGRNPSIGDSVIITGEVDEYYGKTELTYIEDYFYISSGHQLPAPVVVGTGDIEEGHEGVLVRVQNATCTDANYQANFYMWEVDDGSGPLKIHNTSVFEYEPVEGEAYTITGPMNYDWDEWKIDLRFESDVSSGIDEIAPEVIEVSPVLNTNIKVLFSEDVEAESAENMANYSINNDVVIESIAQHAFIKSQVNITVSEMQNNEFELTVENISDLAGNVMDSQTMQFTYSSIGEILFEGSLQVYPNPVGEELNISFNAVDKIPVNIRLLGASGKLMKNKNHTTSVGSNLLQLNMKDIPEGIYFLHLTGENESAQYKVMVR